MTARTSAVVRIWRSRQPRTRADHAYVVYLLAMVALVLVVPVIRAIAMTLTSPYGITVLTSPSAPDATMLAVAGLWAGMLLMGRVRGPALRPPFLAHALAASDMSRMDSFRGPLLRGGLIVVSLVTAVAAAIGSSLAVSGQTTPGSATLFAVAGVCVGVVAVVAWLAGQALPRTAAVLVPVLFTIAALTTQVSALHPYTPWGWVSLAYPSAAPGFASLLPLVALTLAAIAAVPTLMDLLSHSGLIAQSTRWEAASSRVAGMELSDAVSIYGAVPRVGRQWAAISSTTHRTWVFLRRDAVGAARTPIRLAVGVLAMMAAGGLLALSLNPEMPNGVLGAAASVILFAALGPLTDGIRHAASVAGDLPLYGIGDGSLIAHHSLFPLTLTVVVLVASSLIVALLIGHSALAAGVAALVLGLMTLAARVSGAMKGPLPPALLAPVPTPVGDLGAAARLAWALDGLLLTAAAGASVTLIAASPFPALIVGVTIGGLVLWRWRHRR